MNNKLYIAADSSDRMTIEALRPQFKASGYDISVGCPDSDSTAVNDSLEAEFVVLWLTSKTGQQVYDISSGRKDLNATTVNVFAEPMSLTAEQKKAIGRNRSVFSALTPDIVRESVGLLKPTETTAATEKAVSKRTPVEAATPVGDTDNSKQVSGNEETTDNSAQISPFKSLLILVVAYIVVVFLTVKYDCRVNEWKTYLFTSGAFFTSAYAVGGLLGWTEHNGKSFFSRIVLALGWLSLIYYCYCFFRDLYYLIFD